MANRNGSPLVPGARSCRVRASGCRTGASVRRLRVALLACAAAATPLAAQPSEPDARRILVSLEAKRLWLVEGSDTLLTAPVAVGRFAVFRYGDRTWDWRTPQGERTILAKRRDPAWTVPQWHYYERASQENLELVEMVRDVHYPLADGSHLEVRGTDVVRVLGGQFWKVPRGREIIIDGVLYAPPLGTVQRTVPGALGTRALDLGDGYLIHGTNPYNRSTVGGAASHGCVRMENSDVERLFDLVGEGTPVLIY